MNDLSKTFPCNINKWSSTEAAETLWTQKIPNADKTEPYCSQSRILNEQL